EDVGPSRDRAGEDAGGPVADGRVAALQEATAVGRVDLAGGDLAGLDRVEQAGRPGVAGEQGGEDRGAVARGRAAPAGQAPGGAGPPSANRARRIVVAGGRDELRTAVRNQRSDPSRRTIAARARPALGSSQSPRASATSSRTRASSSLTRRPSASPKSVWSFRN